MEEQPRCLEVGLMRLKVLEAAPPTSTVAWSWELELELEPNQYTPHDTRWRGFYPSNRD